MLTASDAWQYGFTVKIIRWLKHPGNYLSKTARERKVASLERIVHYLDIITRAKSINRALSHCAAK